MSAPVKITWEDVAGGMAPPMSSYEVPMSGGQTTRADELAPPPPPPDPGAMVSETLGRSQGSTTNRHGFGEGQTDVKAGVRGALNAASGGLTERTSEAVARAPGQAAEEVELGSLQSLSPAQLYQLYLQANPEAAAAAAAGQVVRVPAGWQPGNRTSAQGTTGKDPEAVRAAAELQSRGQFHGAMGLEGEQAAERSNLDGMQQVQQNEMRAISLFKQKNDAIQNEYDRDRQATNDRLAAIQKAMSADPNAPRTIRQWLDQSGTTDKLLYGIAAAFSMLGGGISKDGGASSRNLINIVQGNIDRKVQAEKDRFDKLGTMRKLEEGNYARLREAAGDDRAALNITKAMYYDAVINATKQLALQYKWDMQQPAVSRMMEHFMQEKQRLILETAATVQEQASQTDKYNPGGLIQVGGGAKAQPVYKGTDLEKDTQEYSKELEKRGANMGERAIGLYQQALDAMKKAGFQGDETFKRALVLLSNPQGDQKQLVGLLATMDPAPRKALQLIISANKEELKDSAGKSVTANELTRDVLEKGGYSPDSLEQARRTLIGNRDQIVRSVDGGFNPVIPKTFWARKQLSPFVNPHPGIGGDTRQPIDPQDVEMRVKGRLEK